MNIAEILKGCPKGTRLYSPIFGELSLWYVLSCSLYPIYCKVIRGGSIVSFAEDGKRNITDAEPTLFPSKNQRDWSEFTAQETKPQFKPFDRVLVRDFDGQEWKCNFFSHISEGGDYVCVSSWWLQCIPYEGNEHLLGTKITPMCDMKKKKYNEWISVKDELPEYEEVVLVCNEDKPSGMWLARRSSNPYEITDSHKFVCFGLEVTHWTRVKPLNKRQYDTNNI